MPSGNGAKAAQKRERNMKKDTKTEAHSQLKANEKALSIVCAICKQPFLGTTSAKSLKEHSDSKHAKQTYQQCFPGQSEP